MTKTVELRHLLNSAIIKAAKDIHSGKKDHSCWALKDAAEELGMPGFYLRELYAEFYEQPKRGTWNDLLCIADHEERRNFRVMLLLNFLEACI